MKIIQMGKMNEICAPLLDAAAAAKTEEEK